MSEIDAQEAEARFGPCWEDVLKVIRQAEALTFDQLARAAALVEVLDEATLNAAWPVERLAAWNAAWPAALAAADATGRAPEWVAARRAAWDAAWDAAFASRPSDAVGTAARAAARAASWAAAAVVSDLVGEHGLTDKHIAVLTWAWREAIDAA